MTRKILAGVLSLIVVASLTSCGKSSKEDNTVASEDSSVTDMKTDDEKKDDSESSTQDISDVDESKIESESSAGEEVGENTGYELTYAVPGTEITYERASIFEENSHVEENHALHEYGQFDDDHMEFFTITDMCTEYNELTVNADDPDSWFDSIKDEFAGNIQKGATNFYTDGNLVINSKELVKVNERTFVKFDITLNDTNTGNNITALGYLTVVKNANIEYYQNGNTIGFMITAFADTADKAFMDEALNHAAETLVVK